VENSVEVLMQKFGVDRKTAQYWVSSATGGKVNEDSHCCNKMCALNYFDTDAFRHFASTYHDRPLSPDLYGKFVLSPITMLEIISQMAEPCAKEIHEQMRGLPNWLNREDVRLLPWPDERISELFGGQSKDDWFLAAVQAFLNQCLMGAPTDDLFEAACQLRDEISTFKVRRANNFQPLMEIWRQDREILKHFSEEWLKCLIPSLRENGDAQKTRILLEALSAYHEFELEKVKVATVNEDYKSYKHRNDVLDAQQLVYCLTLTFIL
jgi:hypothetical protein